MSPPAALQPRGRRGGPDDRGRGTYDMHTLIVGRDITGLDAIR